MQHIQKTRGGVLIMVNQVLREPESFFPRSLSAFTSHRSGRLRGNRRRSVSVLPECSSKDLLLSVFRFLFLKLSIEDFVSLRTVNFPLFEYRIEPEPNARPAPIGSLQIGNAA